MPYKDILSRTCGFVNVEEKEKSGKYQRRYLRLDKGKGVVEWFADNPSNLPKNSKPLGTIDINFITKVDIPTKSKLRAKHSFVVNTPMRRYYFQGEDGADMEEWVEALTNASKIVVSSDDEVNDSQKSLDQVSIKSSNPPEEFSYKTEIVAGVVVQKKMESEDFSAMSNKSDDSKSHRSITSSVSNGSPKKMGLYLAKPIKSGWGVKQGHLRKNWKRRFFVLTTAGFSYFRSDNEKDPIRFISLSEILTAKKDETSLSEHKDNLFFVATTERIYYIQADSPEEMTSWIKSFHDAIHYSSSLKRRSKDKKSSSKTSAALHGTPTTTNTARKLDVSLSVASASQRNSTYLGNNAGRTSASNRLSSADEALYRSLTPYKSRSHAKPNLPREWRVASSSEESGGLSSSVDSLSTTLADTKLNNQSPTKHPKKESKKKAYVRSMSGTDIFSTEPKSAVPKSVEQSKERRSFPLPESVSKEHQVASIPSCASFSSPSTRSSGSFSTSSQTSKPTRSFLLDPKVDHRAAVKPSSVKKKRNTGILFSLNNMLNKKAEKMSSAEKKRRAM